MAELTVGQVVDGRYELEAVIGKGGMGCVFRARHVITHGKVALKVLTDTVDAELQQRFLAEARAASTIGHPAIVAVSDASRTPDGQLYLVMELLAGKPLRDSLRAGLPGDQIRRVGLELLDALGAAHRQGIVHRDLKPENIFLLAGTGAVKVLDFGIAKVLGATTSTVTGHILGTLEYMAPEQLLDAATVDGRADLWATGIILYELIAGVRPFGGATREAKYAALATEEPMAIEDVVSVSPDVAAFFKVALARDPDQRFQTAADMSAALRRLSMVPQTSTHVAQTEVGATLGTGAVQWANVPDLRHSVMSARALPPSTHAPPNISGHAIQPAGSPSAGKKVALAAVALVVAFGIAFGVVMATRGKADEPKPVDAAVAQVVDAKTPTKPQDAVVIVAVPDAGEQWAPPDARALTPADATPAPAIGSGTCEDHCKRMESCGMRDSACLNNCARGAINECMAEASTCEQLAGCYWSMQCSDRVVKTSTFTCKQANDCYVAWDAGMRQENICDKCIDKFSPGTAWLRASLEVCRSIEAKHKRAAEKANRDPDPEVSNRCDNMQLVCVKDH